MEVKTEIEVIPVLWIGTRLRGKRFGLGRVAEQGGARVRGSGGRV